MKRYVVIPGFISSKNDGDRHYVGARQLMNLYGVEPSECLIFSYNRKGISLEWLRSRGLVELSPRYDGDYSLQEAIE